MSTLRAGQLRHRRSIPGRSKIYFSPQPRLNRFRDTPSLYTMGIKGSFSGYKAGRGVKLTVHLHLAPTSKTHGAISPSPPTPSWRAQGQFYLHHLIFVYERCTADSYTNDSLSKHIHTTRGYRLGLLTRRRSQVIRSMCPCGTVGYTEKNMRHTYLEVLKKIQEGQN